MPLPSEIFERKPHTAVFVGRVCHPTPVRRELSLPLVCRCLQKRWAPQERFWSTSLGRVDIAYLLAYGTLHAPDLQQFDVSGGGE